MLRNLVVFLFLTVAYGFAPISPFLSTKLASRSTINGQRPFEFLAMKLGVDEKVILIGVAADSGCGKSTFMRRLTKVFGGKNVGPLGGGFGTPGGWETNTLVSDMTTVICLDDYHLNDRGGRKKSGLTALNVKEQKFDLMFEQLKALKEGKSISKPIYNHVNGTIDTPETIEPTPIVIVEGLHPMVDPRVRSLLDFTIYLDISDEVKFAWKIQRDTQERGWTVEQVKESIEQRKPDFAAYVAPQREFSDVVITVLPSEISQEPVGKHLKVKLIQRTDKPSFKPSYILKPEAKVTVIPEDVKVGPTVGVKLASYKEKFFNKDVSVVELDGKLEDIKDYSKIDAMLSNTGAKTPTELSDELIKVGANSPGSLDGTGLFQTVTALKLREFYESVTGSKVKA
jgi:phosphoribulokinase